MVYCRGELLTPVDAPPLARILRNSHIEEIKAMVPPLIDPWENEIKLPEPKTKTMWYSSEETKLLHSNSIEAGMKRAQQEGRRIGRPRVSERPEFDARLAGVLERINRGILSRRKGARELDIGYATLKRIIEAQSGNAEQSQNLLLAVG